ncbi:membrane protein insertase YidC [Corynebacterium sp. CCM 8835]|uniref:Membrane protein insertase YidC n=1 Tax=Corynebacterium antarcticum TaxID=2800405 RepID=A0A9Q4CFV9_9CORY|nr:membrane protein insertase YidC [Corynebacterium antarcticum]MCK7643158.1 membrane protein insertase YidC [Corynebacterium antarcticum]MCL0246680.1 membrane protein insertase YidC [Corynebacterium antarcticum]MCX7492821.1 membrane protein insertase YidC [Corynebacterium antarcticum]MCX7538684.1 membrane protein insertase YidC [Corynebacterium antarcticum]
MLDILIYPVSGVMKLWHIALHSWIGLDDSLAWLLSLFGLIVTVRLIILPFAWAQYRSTRILVNLRPKLHSLEEEYGLRTDAEANSELSEKRRELYKEHRYSPVGGCVPALIQLPVFIGLYQVLLRMARPTDGLDAARHQPIGFLTPTDIETFLHGRINGVPMPAYPAMSTDQLTTLGTDRDAVFNFVLPFLIAAAVFMTINMLVSIYRTQITLDHQSAVARRIQHFMITLAVIVPIFPLAFGLKGPVPAAIALYWFAGNLWTMCQTIILNLILDRKHPLTEEFTRFREESKRQVRTRLRRARAARWGIRRRRLLMLVLPHRIGRLHRRNVEVRREMKAEAEALKAPKREARKKRREAARERDREKLRKKMEEKAKTRKKKLRSGGEPDEPTDGNSPGDASPDADPGVADAQAADAETPADAPDRSTGDTGDEEPPSRRTDQME